MPALVHFSNSGPLTAADLEAARRDNPGCIWHPQIAGRDTCTGRCESAEGCNCWQPQPAEAATEIGAEVQADRAWLGLLLIALPWVLGVGGWAVWVRFN